MELKHKSSEKNIRFLPITSTQYPKSLKEICDPPKGIYYKGKLPEDGKRIAIVGARNCSVYGREMAVYFGRELARKGIQVISGMARGIDGYAHRGALDGGGETFAVLGNGLDICYPPEHDRLALEIAGHGGLLSEYPPGEPALSWHFPLRNRIISGLSDGILVIEAKEKSGSLITVEQGLEQGKDIFSLPGRVGDLLSRGCNRLLKEGAIPVTEPGDILSYYGIDGTKEEDKNKKNYNRLEMEEEMVYSKVCLEPRHLDQIARECGLELFDTMETLYSLEMKKLVTQPLKNYYIRRLQ